MSLLCRRVHAVVVMLGVAGGRDGVRENGGSGASGVGGSGRVRRSLVVAAAVVVGAFGVVAAPASAALEFPYLRQIPGSPNGPFANSYSSAVDDVAGSTLTGDTLVADSDSVDVLDSSGNYVTSWNGSAATNPPGTPEGSFGGRNEVAVNETSGDIYVLDGFFDVVDILTPSGAYGSQITNIASNSGLAGNIGGIAVDQASGDVYVGDNVDGVVDVFSSTGTLVSTITPPVGVSFTSILSIAVNSSTGEVYVADSRADQVYAFRADGVGGCSQSGGCYDTALIGTPTQSFSGQLGVAVDNAGDVLVADSGNDVVTAFDSSGNLLGQITGTSGGRFLGPLGVSVDPASGDVYVNDLTVAGGSAVLDVFGPGVVVPDVTTSPASNVTTTSATLGGTVNPDSGSLTSCEVEYVDAADYNPSAADPYSAGQTQACSPPLPTGSTAEPVSADVAGLMPGTTYHFRQEASNSNGTNFGGDQTFITGAVVDSQFVTGVTASSVTLNAQINPEGLDTTYHFEYGSAGPCSSNPCTSVPVPDGDVGSGSSDVSVEQAVAGLQAGTVYHYRVVATNSEGVTPGADLTFTTESAGTGFSLPDGRAYEQVTPADKGDGQLPPPSGAQLPVFTQFGDQAFQAAADGNAYAYATLLPLPGSQSGGDDTYVATRGSAAWSSQSLLPPQATPTGTLDNPEVVAFSQDLSHFLLNDGGGRAASGAGQDDPPLVPGEPANNPNLFIGDAATSTWALANVTPPGVTPAAANFEGASADASTVVFASAAPLTPDALPPAAIPTASNLFAWHGGAVSLISLVPTGSATSCGVGGPACTAVGVSGVGAGTSGDSGARGAHVIDAVGAVSSDGSRIAFTAGQDLYVRENGDQTVEVSAPNPGVVDPNGPLPKTYWWMSPDGSELLFTSCQKLTDDSTAVRPSAPYSGEPCDGGNTVSFPFPSGNDLYEYSMATGKLTDLSVDHTATDSAGADVQGVLGASGDGSYVYFAANGVLASNVGSDGSRAQPGNCTGHDNPGACNLYVWHDGTVTFIGALNDLDDADWFGNQNGIASMTARVTPNGRYLAFESVNRLTGYDNTVAAASRCGIDLATEAPLLGAQCTEVFLYDAASGRLTCASCNPTGERPTGPSDLTPLEPDPTQGLGQSSYGFYLPRNLSSDGSRLFFSSEDALLPQATDGQENVYEFEQAGAGSCSDANGCLYLISRGTSTGPSQFMDASANGNDVFFETFQALVPTDTDQRVDVYDARVGGGFPFTPAAPACSGEDCKPPATAPPAIPVAATVSFSGPGDVASSRSAVRIRLLRGVVRGGSVRLSVRVPGPGRLRVSGAWLEDWSRGVGRGGTYGVTVRLTRRALAELRHKRQLVLEIRVAYVPAAGTASAADVKLTAKGR